MEKPTLIRVATSPISLNILLKGQLHYLSKHWHVIGLSSPGNELHILNKRENIEVKAIKMKRNISIFADIQSLVSLWIYFLKTKPQIVHSITPKAGLLSMIAAKFANIPVRMHTFTGLIFPSKSGLLQKLLISTDKILCWAATNVYAEGNGVLNDLIRYKIASKPIKIIANGNINGVNCEYFNPNAISEIEKIKTRSSLNIKNSDFVFLFVGRIVGDKGIHELISAFKTISSPNLKLILVGPFEKELDPISTNTLKEIESNPNIILTGFVEDVRPYYSISHVFVFPSYREGFPNAVLQAAAMGLPSIVTDINGCNEIITNNKNGIIIPPKNSKALSTAMKTLLNDPIKRSEMSANSTSEIKIKFNNKLVWAAQEDEYFKLICRHAENMPTQITLQS